MEPQFVSVQLVQITPISLGVMVDVYIYTYIELGNGIVNQQTSLGGHHLVQIPG